MARTSPLGLMHVDSIIAQSLCKRGSEFWKVACSMEYKLRDLIDSLLRRTCFRVVDALVVVVAVASAFAVLFALVVCTHFMVTAIDATLDVIEP